MPLNTFGVPEGAAPSQPDTATSSLLGTPTPAPPPPTSQPTVSSGSPVVSSTPNVGQGIATDLNGELPFSVQFRTAGHEYSYTEITGVANITVASTEAAPATLIAPAAITLDGSAVLVEAFFPQVAVGAALGATLGINLWDNGVDLGRLAIWSNPTANAYNPGPAPMHRRFIPASGVHVFALRAWATGATSSVNPGAGGAGVTLPGYIQITRV